MSEHPVKPVLDYSTPPSPEDRLYPPRRSFLDFGTGWRGVVFIIWMFFMGIWSLWLFDVNYSNWHGEPGFSPRICAALLPLMIVSLPILIVWGCQMNASIYWSSAFAFSVCFSIYSLFVILWLGQDPGHPQPRWRFENKIWLWITLVSLFASGLSLIGLLLSRKLPTNQPNYVAMTTRPASTLQTQTRRVGNDSAGS